MLSAIAAQLTAEHLHGLSEHARRMIRRMFPNVDFSATIQPKPELLPPRVAESPATTTTEYPSTADDGQSDIGSWEQYAKENNLRVEKHRRTRSIRRLRDVIESGCTPYEERKAAVAQPVELVPNPFCIRNRVESTASDASSIESSSLKYKRVCFNPNVTYHFYDREN